MKAIATILFVLSFRSGAHAVQVLVYVYGANCSSGVGYAIATANGGTPPYTYAWSEGSTGSEVALPPGGDYSVTVTDNMGTTATVNFIVSGASAPPTGTGLLWNIFFPGLEPCQGECNGGFRLYLPRIVGGYTFDTSPPMQVQEYENPTPGPVEGLMSFEFVGACPGQVVDLTVWNDCSAGFASVTIPDAVPDPTVGFTQITGSCSGTSNGYIAGTIGWTGQFLTAGWNMHAVDDQGGAVPSQPLTFDSAPVMPFAFSGLHPGNWDLHFTSMEGDNSIQAPCVVDVPFVIPDLGGACGALSGRAFVDVNENCFQGFGEPDLPQTVVVAQPGDHYALTNASGQYSMNLPFGSYTVTTSSANYAEHCGTSTTPFALSAGQPSVVRNLADTSLVGLDMLVFAGSGPARPGFPLTMLITLRNLTGVPAGNGTVTLTLDPTLNYVGATPVPGTVNGNVLTWSSTNIGALQQRSFTLDLLVPPDINLLGTMLTSTVTASVTNPEAALDNNTFVHMVMVTGAYDPNDKTALTSSRESTDLYFIDGDDWIDYTIRFQNTGTDTAFLVVVTDTLPATLDPGTFQMGTGSHPYTVSLSGQGVLRWNFANIQLPDSNVNEPRSHGFITFRTRPRQPVLPGTLIENIANIYFDFNPPVITQPSVLVATTGTGVVEQGSGPHLQLMPNPTDGLLWVQISDEDHTAGQLRVLAMEGRVLLEQRMDGSRLALDVKRLAAGTYLLEHTGEGGARSVQCFVKQ